jgi:hypothetical protein
MAHSWHIVIKKMGVFGQFSLIFRQCLDGANTRFMVGNFDADVIRAVMLKWVYLMQVYCGVFFITVPRVCHDEKST